MSPTQLFLVNSTDADFTNECKQAAFNLQLRFSEIKCSLTNDIESLQLSLKSHNDDFDLEHIGKKCMFVFCDFDSNVKLLKQLSSAYSSLVIGPPVLRQLSKKRCLEDLSSISRKNHPRYNFTLKSFSVIMVNGGHRGHPHKTNPRDTSLCVSMIRWLGGLIRDDIKPDRPNQIVLTNSHSNDKRLRRAVALDIPILQYECLDKLWAMKDDESFRVTETFKSTYKIKALQDCLIYFHGLNDSEINLTHERTRQLEGEVALSIDEPGVTHIIMEQPYDRELLQKIVDNDLLSTVQVLRLEWFWESVKADTQALEENHTIDVFQVLNDSERVHGKKAFASQLTESAVSREKLLSQIAKESREEEPEINDLVLPGYSRRDRYRASPESRRTSHSNNSILSKPNVSALVFDKSIDRNTDYSHADSDDQTINPDQTQIKKASSCPLIDQIEAAAVKKIPDNDDLATSTPARSRRSLSSQASSLRGSREKSLDNLSNSSKRKITEQRSEISATESSESKISRKNTILQSKEELNTPKIVHIDDNGLHRLITKEESLQLERERLENSPPLSRKGSRKYTDLPQLKTIEKNSEKKKSKRYMIIEELFTVETQYLKTLNFIIKEFKMPLEEEAKLPVADEHDFDTDHDTTSVVSLSNNFSPNPGQGASGAILPLARVRSIFGHIDLIYEVHCALFEELQEFIVNWNPENSIGEMMKKYAEDFKRVYPPFLSYFPQIKAELDECTKLYHRFAAHIMLAERKRSDRSKLIDLMIQPVQRLMRYPLIFQRLKSTTQKECAMSHPDNICLEAVTKLFENVSSMVNESKRKTEDYQAMLHLTQKIERFPPNLVSASRQFIQEIDCYYRSSLNVKKKATLFMFNDYIIVCTRQRLHTFTSKINRKRYSFYEQINMHHIQKLLICNDEDQPSTNLSRTKSRLKITQTRSDIRDLKTSKPGESLYGLGFMTTSNVVNWYSINIANDWQRRDAGTQRQVSAPGMEMNKSRINDKRYSNNYDYINGVKELILDLICKCKGKLTTDAMVKSMSLEEVACLLGQEKEGNLTPHESISDLSIISDTNSTRSAMFHDEGRENQTPSPTLSGFGNTTRFDRRASFGSKKLLEFGKTMKKSIVNGLTKNATFRNLHQAASMSNSQTTTGTFATPKSVPRSRNNTTSRMRSQSTQQVADDKQILAEKVPSIQVHGATPDAHTRRLNSASHDNGLTMMHNYTLSNLHNVQSSTPSRMSSGRSMTNLREPTSRGKPTFQTLV